MEKRSRWQYWSSFHISPKCKFTKQQIIYTRNNVTPFSHNGRLISSISNGLHHVMRLFKALLFFLSLPPSEVPIIICSCWILSIAWNEIMWLPIETNIWILNINHSTRIEFAHERHQCQLQTNDELFFFIRKWLIISCFLFLLWFRGKIKFKLWIVFLDMEKRKENVASRITLVLLQQCGNKMWVYCCIHRAKKLNGKFVRQKFHQFNLGWPVSSVIL